MSNIVNAEDLKPMTAKLARKLLEDAVEAQIAVKQAEDALIDLKAKGKAATDAALAVPSGSYLVHTYVDKRATHLVTIDVDVIAIRDVEDLEEKLSPEAEE